MEAIMLSLPDVSACDADSAQQPPEWRGELASRVEAYRLRRQKLPRDGVQTKLPFTEPTTPQRKIVRNRPVTQDSFPLQTKPVQNSPIAQTNSVAVEEQPASGEEDFAFTIAIGRINPERRVADRRMMIDVSIPNAERYALAEESEVEKTATQTGQYPVAPMEDRRIAGLIDVGCLLFACGGFLALFGSLGGHFTFSKLNAVVCVAALAVVYLQYFALFTVFGGTTPGMMLRGLQVVSFSGEEPTPRQMLLRSAGYMLSAGTVFLGFLWSMWDEDGLTWHDRISHTYLSAAETYADIEARRMAHR